MSTYEFSLPGERLLALKLCEAEDRLSQIRAQIDRSRWTTRTARGGERLSPLVREERELRTQIATLSRLLRIHLWSEDAEEEDREPADAS